MSPKFALLTFDGVIIGVALASGVDKLVQQWGGLTFINAITFFIAAINFFHGKLNLISDNEYQDYADSRNPVVELVDFVLHILTLGSFAFMPHYLVNMKGYLMVHVSMRTFDALLVLVVSRSVRRSQLPATRKSRIGNTNRDWLVIDIIVILTTGLLLGMLWGVATFAGMQILAASVLLTLGIADIGSDYYFHREYYFGTRQEIVTN